MADFFKSLQRALDRDQGGGPVWPDDYLPDPEYCTHIVYQQTLTDPAAYCENYAVGGEELCAQHLPEDDDFGWGVGARKLGPPAWDVIE